MDQRTTHNLVWIPIFLIGMIALILGFIWLVHPEPWLVDQDPNEALIQTSFKNLFLHEINNHLSSYLIVLYRFFGLWLITIGFLIMAFVKVTRLGTTSSQGSIYFILSIVLIGLFYLIFTFLPSSPLVPILYLLTILLGCSIYFSRRLNE
ncbi:MAG: hypothetical protein ACJZ12_05345 [Candidatus Neomarinimicrobiota bacterium]